MKIPQVYNHLNYTSELDYRLLLGIFESIDHPVYISDPNTYSILYANKVLTVLFGNVTGRKCYRVFQNLKSPCPFCTNNKILGKNTGKAYIWEFQNRSNNRWYHCIDRAIKWENGQLVRCEIAIDITDKKLSQQVSEESGELFSTVTENSPNMIFINKNGRIVYVNKKCEEIMGYRKNELLSPDFSFMKLIAPEYRDLVKSNFTKHNRGLDTTPCEYDILTKSGKRINTVVSTKIVKYSGEPAIMGIITDVTKYKESNRRLEVIMNETVKTLALTAEKRDLYTSGHQQRVTKLAHVIAEMMKLPKSQVDGIRVAANLHDIGKINIPIELLSKPAKLTDAEYNLVKAHCQSSYDILKHIEFPWPIAEIIIQHHERINGSGYPNGLKGKDILLEAKIIAVADVVEAMAHHRPYRAALGIREALAEIKKNKGTLYDINVANTCLRLFRTTHFRF